jgi:hypothetical protein
VVDELKAYLPAEIECETLDFGLHIQPSVLKTVLQNAINASTGYDNIILAYGLCSMAVVGLKSDTATLIVPKVDDCIAIFLGSKEAHRRQLDENPGTYYFTKGWIEYADTPFDEFDRMVERYGAEKAQKVMAIYLRNYTRLALIDTGVGDLEQYRDHSRTTAARFGLRFEEIKGASTLIEKMINGPWDRDFVVVPPGQAITYNDFCDLSANNANKSG